MATGAEPPATYKGNEENFNSQKFQTERPRFKAADAPISPTFPGLQDLTRPPHTQSRSLNLSQILYDFGLHLQIQAAPPCVKNPLQPFSSQGRGGLCSA